MSQTRIIVKGVSVNQDDGRVTYTLQCVTTDDLQTWEGPIRQYSFDPEILRDRFNNSLQKFEQWAAAQQQSLRGASKSVMDEIAQRKGAVLSVSTE